MAQYDVSDRSAIVTGAGSGIGRSAALLLAQNGASVVVNDLNAEAAQDVVDEIRAAGGVAAASVGDATDAEWIASSIDLAGTLAPLRIGVNNAGISGASFPTAEYPGDDWDKVIAINLNAVFRNMKAQIPTILGNGGGSVVNVASILGSVGFAGSPAYVAAKHGVVGMTKSAALEYSAQGVRVNSVGPRLHRHSPAGPHGCRCEGVPRVEASDRSPRTGGRGRTPHRVPRERRRQLHHRQLPPRGWRVHGALTDSASRSSPEGDEPRSEDRKYRGPEEEPGESSGERGGARRSASFQ